MFVGLVDTRKQRPDPNRNEPLWLDLPELRPWRWYVATIVFIVLADHLNGWAGVVAVMVGLGCALYGVSTYTRGNDGLSKYQQ
jgi:hypothetical protein